MNPRPTLSADLARARHLIELAEEEQNPGDALVDALLALTHAALALTHVMSGLDHE
jgi:hypothetical protein